MTGSTRGDAAGIAELYAEDAVNHQIPLTPVVGRTAIEEFHRFRRCGLFQVRDDLIVQQRGYWDSAQLNEIHPAVHTD